MKHYKRMRNSVVTWKTCARRFAAMLIVLALLLPLAGTAVAASSEYTIHRTSGISWHSDLWVLMYCRKGYTAVHGGYAKPPSGLEIVSSGPLRAGGLSMWAIEVRNTTSRWLELHSWATCAKG